MTFKHLGSNSPNPGCYPAVNPRLNRLGATGLLLLLAHARVSYKSSELTRASKMAVNGQRDVNSRYPSSNDAGNSITQNGFKITTKKRPILKAEPIERMTTKLGITPPEMIFGENSVAIEHSASGWGISFNAFDALDRVDKSGGSMLQVAHSKEWQSTRYAGLRT